MSFKVKDLHRIASFNMYRTKRIELCRMSFVKDFVKAKEKGRADLYPLIDSVGEGRERVSDGYYSFQGTSRESSAYRVRLFGGLFPYASYEMRISTTSPCGFRFTLPSGSCDVLTYTDEFGDVYVKFSSPEGEEARRVDRRFCGGGLFTVILRPGRFDVFLGESDRCSHVCTFQSKSFDHSHKEESFRRGSVAVYLSAGSTVTDVSGYIDCGMSQADMRPVKYEDGSVMEEGGRVFLTMTARGQVEMYQIVIAWKPGTSEIEMTGAYFFDVGDGYWCSDVASSLIYDRRKGSWYLWYCSFSHDHVLAHAEFKHDIRYGVNVVDTILMEKLPPELVGTEEGDRLFFGKSGDEDPDLIYSEKDGKWYMSICRVESLGKGEDGRERTAYRYHLFSSDHPFEGYTFLTKGTEGSETGGSLIPMGDDIYFLCGSDFDRNSVYHLYELPTFGAPEIISHDYPDGGFRGWGTIITVCRGTRRLFYHFTFDRHNCSSYNWSYGNIHIFEGTPEKL